MEDTHRVNVYLTLDQPVKVLILVLMEDTHRAAIAIVKTIPEASLNPCSNGRYSQSYEYNS